MDRHDNNLILPTGQPALRLLPALWLLTALVALGGCGNSAAGTADAGAGAGADAGADAGAVVAPACEGDAGCPCALPDSGVGEGACFDGLVCDATTARCRAALGCEGLGCVSRQLCERPDDGGDFTCLDACEPGFAWDADRGGCSAVPATCNDAASDAEGAEAPIAAGCAALSRSCIDDADGARCGLCVAGTIAAGGRCRPVVSCDDALTAECEARGRSCEQPDAARDARCAACPEDSAEDASGNCLPQRCEQGMLGSIAGTCAARRRACVESDTGAACGGCYANHVSTNAGDCRPVETCAALACHLRNRSCNDALSGADAACGDCRAGYLSDGFDCMPDPGADCVSLAAGCAAEQRACAAGACAGCLPGHVEDPDTGRCEPEIDCAQCEGEGRVCEQAGGRTACGDCAPLFRLQPESGQCVPTVRCKDPDSCSGGAGCLGCDAGQVCVAAVGSQDASCRPDCAPLPGSDRGRVWNGYQCVGCPPCDGPGEDGPFPLANVAGECICRTQPGYYYTRAADVGAYACDADGDGWVREGARTAIEGEDLAIAENARCNLRQADAVVLENERGVRQTVQLEQPLQLYETDRNDDAYLLSRYRERGGFGLGFGSDRDLDGALLPGPEHLNRFTKYCHLPSVDYNDNGSADVDEWGGQAPLPGSTPQQDVFNRFSHFAELHTGSFEATGATATGERGHFVISERPRSEPGFPLGFGAGEDPYWQMCSLRADARAAVLQRPVGMDFAQEAPGGLGEGMLLHSLFKCIAVRDAPDAAAPQEAEADPGGGYQYNDCRITGVDGAAPELQCAPTDAITAGDVRWAGVRFEPYAQNQASYENGCVDECAEDLAGTLVGPTVCPRSGPGALVACAADALAFGRNTCGEVCEDGLDNDGDDIVDETDPPLDSDCESGLPGVCGYAHNGRIRCEAGQLVCRTTFEAAPYDLCGRGGDDDCDGSVDEDEDPGAPHPGEPRSGDACDTARPGICAAGVQVCRDLHLPPVLGQRLLVCNSVSQPEQDSCDDIDNDCDGSTDEGLELASVCGAPAPCSVAGGVGLCARGNSACVDGAEVCVPLIAPGEGTEVCNGHDDDCDGVIDNPPVCDRSAIGYFSVYPLVTAGDREFAGNGPLVEIDLLATNNGTSVTVGTTVTMTEVNGSSVGEVSDEATIDAPAGATVVQILNPAYRLEYRDEDQATDFPRWDAQIPRSPPPEQVVTAEVIIDESPQRDLLEAGDSLLLGAACIGDSAGDDLEVDSFCHVHYILRYRIAYVPSGTCGNGALEAGEGCDDGNVCPSDGCNPTCTGN